jgi:hypothetical protein
MPEEFFLHPDFDTIVESLGAKSYEDVEYTLTDEERDGVPGRVMSGVLKSAPVAEPVAAEPAPEPVVVATEPAPADPAPAQVSETP